MQSVSVDYKELRAALSLVRKTIDTHSAPIMACVRLRSCEYGLHLCTGTWDTETGVKLAVGPDASSDIDICVPVGELARCVNAWLGRSRTTSIRLTIDNDALSLEGQRYLLHPSIEPLPHSGPRDYHFKHTYRIQWRDMMPALAAVVGAASTDPTKPEAMSNILMATSVMGYIEFVATDGVRLHVMRTEVKLESNDRMNAVLPRLFCTQWLRMASGKSEFDLHVGGDQLSFGVDAGNTHLSTFVKDSEYPDYRKQLKVSDTARATFSSLEMLRALNGLELGKDNPVDLKLSRDHISLTGRGVSCAIAATTTRTPAMFTLENRYLRDVLKAVDCDQMSMQTAEGKHSLEPVRFSDTKGRFTAIVMPRRPV